MADERVKQNELNCADDLEAFIQDNNFLDIEDTEEGDKILEDFEVIVNRFKLSHTELKLELGDQYDNSYKHREKYFIDARGYIKNVKTRLREVKKAARQNAANEKARDREYAETEKARDREQAEELVKLKLRHAAEEKARDREQGEELKKLELQYALEMEQKRLQQLAEEKARDKEIELNSLVNSSELAKEALLLSLDEVTDCSYLSIPDLERLKAELSSSSHQFCVASSNLSISFDDQYREQFEENFNKISSDAKNEIQKLTLMIREKQANQGDLAQKESEKNLRFDKNSGWTNR